MEQKNKKSVGQFISNFSMPILLLLIFFTPVMSSARSLYCDCGKRRTAANLG